MADSNKSYNITNVNYNVKPSGLSSRQAESYFGFFLSGFAVIFLGMCIVRGLSNGGSISLETLLDFLANHFGSVSGWIRNLNVPSLMVNTADVPLMFTGFVGVWNNIVNFFSVVTYICGLILDVLYTAVSILVWVLTGVAI